MSSEPSPAMCRACGRRDGTHETDCWAVKRAAKDKLQAECDHRPEYGVTQTTGIPLGSPCCGRCDLELQHESEFDTCCGKDIGDGDEAPAHERRVCQCYAPACTNYLCAVCGVIVAWRRDLMIVNPTISGRFCTSCVDVEAAYHGLSIEEMRACRARLRIKRIAADLSTRGTPLPQGARHRFEQEVARARAARLLPASALPERVLLVERSNPRDVNEQPSRPYLERGEACWCHRAKDCDGNHEFHNVTVHIYPRDEGDRVP